MSNTTQTLEGETQSTSIVESEHTEQTPVNHIDEPNNIHKKHVKPEHLRKYWWKPGQSGNPKGRPKRTEVLTDLLWAELKRKDKKLGEVKQKLLIRKLVDKAIAGDMRAQQLVIERLWGKTPESVQISGRMGHVEIPLQAILESVANDPERARELATTFRRAVTDGGQ